MAEPAVPSGRDAGNRQAIPRRRRQRRRRLRRQPGEIHALLGENGAGKSTLMNILFGLYHPDEGEILVNGQPVRFSSPRDAVARRLGMVHQHFMLIPRFTVTENVILGSEGPGVVLDRAARRARVERTGGANTVSDSIPDASRGLAGRRCSNGSRFCARSTRAADV